VDQELKQRLIGAAVITALAAIFVPMLFDDPVDETGKAINQLTVPPLPAQVQEAEKAKLPEKPGDIAAIPVNPANPNGGVPDASTFEADVEVAPADVQATADEVPPPVVEVVSNQPDQKVGIKPLKPDNLQVNKPAATEIKPVKKDPKVAAAAKAEEKVLKALQTPNPTAPTKVYLQVGTFSQKNNAVTFQESLKQQGFAATIKESGGEKGSIYKVLS
jgi:DedD protein